MLLECMRGDVCLCTIRSRSDPVDIELVVNSGAGDVSSDSCSHANRERLVLDVTNLNTMHSNNHERNGTKNPTNSVSAPTTPVVVPGSSITSR